MMNNHQIELPSFKILGDRQTSEWGKHFAFGSSPEKISKEKASGFRSSPKLTVKTDEIQIGAGTLCSCSSISLASNCKSTRVDLFSTQTQIGFQPKGKKLFQPGIYLGYLFPAFWVQALRFALGFVANKILLEILFADTSPRLRSRADQEESDQEPKAYSDQYTNPRWRQNLLQQNRRH